MFERKTIVIPSPIAVTGQKVSVMNYRRRSMQIWEEGIVRHNSFTYQWSKEGYWIYVIDLDRQSSYGKPITLTVTDEFIKLATYDSEVKEV